MGRNRLPSDKKRSRITITLDKSTFEYIESKRGNKPRSDFIENIIKKSMPVFTLDE